MKNVSMLDMTAMVALKSIVDSFDSKNKSDPAKQECSYS